MLGAFTLLTRFSRSGWSPTRHFAPGVLCLALGVLCLASSAMAVPDAPLAPRISNVTQTTASVLPHGGNEKQQIAYTNVHPQSWIEFQLNGNWGMVMPSYTAEQLRTQLGYISGIGQNNVQVTKNQTSGGQATTNISGQYPVFGYGDPGQSWSIGNGSPSFAFSNYYLQYDYGNSNAQTLTGYGMEVYGAQEWRVLGSNTGAFNGEETVIDTQTAYDDWMYDIFSIESPGSYRYYRWVFDVARAGNNYNIWLSFIDIPLVNQSGTFTIEYINGLANTNVGQPQIEYAPSGVTFSTLQQGGISLPMGATNLTLQVREVNGSWSDAATGILSGQGATITSLTAGTDYETRWVAVDGVDSTPGAVTGFTTLPAAAPNAPDAPTFSNIAQTTLTVTLPELPARADTLTLQRSASAGWSWTTLDDELAGEATYNDTGLTAGTTYLYRAVAVNTNGSIGGTPGQVTTSPPAPSAPAAPQILSVGRTTLLVKAPALPAYGLHLMLQYRLDWQMDEEDWVTVAQNLAAGAETEITGLTPDTGYAVRYIAHGVSGNTPGSENWAWTLFPLPSAPGAPVFTGLGAQRVTVTPPSYPSYCDHLRLERKLTGDGDETYQTVADMILGVSGSQFTDLTPETSYTFRYVAIGYDFDEVVGTAASVTTTAMPPAPDAPGTPSFPTSRRAKSPLPHPRFQLMR